jgi:hypothetical protein
VVIVVLVAICLTLITGDTKQEQALLSNSGGCIPALPGAKAGGKGERFTFGKAEAVVVEVFVVKLVSVRKRMQPTRFRTGCLPNSCNSRSGVKNTGI